jgi:phosphoribosylformylglycinamidine cyclo-ligase
MTNAYARAGVDTAQAADAVDSLVAVLKTIRLPNGSRAVLGSGHYANVLEVGPNLGVAIGTDGVGSKAVIAEQIQQFDTIGIDCIAMNVNDVICVGARPIALVDYIAVERADPEMLKKIGEGLKRGAEDAGIEIPGGELAQLPEIIRGHPSPYGFDLSGTCVGTVALDQLIIGQAIEPDDVILGIPSSGVHANGLTLARKALLVDGGYSLSDCPPELGGTSIAKELLRPTLIYVRAVMALLASGTRVRGLAHITSTGFCNLLRLEADVGYQLDRPLPRLPIFELIQKHGRVAAAEMYEVFNMGCGFCCVVAPEDELAAIDCLANFHPGVASIGRVTRESGVVRIPSVRLRGDRHHFVEDGSSVALEL